MTKNTIIALAKKQNLTANYSGNQKTIFVKGENSEIFIKKFTPDKNGNIRNSKGHFIKGLNFKVLSA